MGSIGKSFALILILIMAISSLIAVRNAYAQLIPKPSVPEFTVNLTDNSYITKETTSVDPYTGKTVQVPSQYIANYSIEITVKNQHLETGYPLYYNVRTKGHFAQNWTDLYGDEYSPPESNSSYTVITFSSKGIANNNYVYGPNHASFYVVPEAQIDFQVQAFLGGQDYNPLYPGAPGGGRYFKVETESDWSSTQTITIPSASASPSPTPTVPEFPTWVILPLFAMVILLSIVFIRKKIAKK